MIGQGVLRECLLDPGVERVLSIGRSPSGQTHAKLRDLVHRDLFDADFWNRMQALHRAGEIVDIFPYQDDRRLRGR